MEAVKLLEMLHTAERLKNETRHCDTSTGRRESVAEHCWRLALMAFWLKDEFKNLDMNKVIAMCLIHDLGEAFTGDIPAFEKSDDDIAAEDAALAAWVGTLPYPVSNEMRELYAEMDAQLTDEARLYKALDGIEAVIQHNESDISSWLPNEYDLQLTYCNDRVRFSPWLTEFREQIRKDSIEKIERNK